MALPAGTRLGPYEVIGPLGAGGMGEVYRARDTRLSREVAIKVLPPELVNDPERRARFEREAQAISALNHPHIVTLHEIGTSEAGPYLVLEKIEGQSLRDLLASGRVPLRRLTALAAQIADGLAKAHAAGVVHRDLKPDNVMVTADGFAKILDFGLARLAWPNAEADDETTLARDTATGMILGTLGYLSPEQASGKPADFRADQFALGALLYEMASRERPFKRGTMAESLAATLRDEPPPLGPRRADLPQPFVWIVERCLAKDPDDRYASTRDLARDLADVRDRLSDLQRVPTEDGTAPAQARRAGGGIWWIALAAGAVALVAAGYGAAQLLSKPDADAPTYRALTFRRGIVTGAKFGPEGKTIYYSAAFGQEPSRVYVTRVDAVTSELLKLQDPAHLLSVSAKGVLAVVLTTDRNPSNSTGTLASLQPIGGTPRRLLENVIDADWAPDGERLAVRRPGGAIEFPIGTTLVPSGALQPRVAPRGNHIAWIVSGGVRIADPDGRVIVSHDLSFAFGLAWRPDGREVWFTGQATGGGNERALYGLSLDGSVRLIARAPGSINLFDVGPDGRSALISTGSSWFGIESTSAGSAGPRNLDMFGRTFLVGLSADGTRLLLEESSEVGKGIYLRTTDGGQTIPLSRSRRALGLSPDGLWALECELRTVTECLPDLVLEPTAATAAGTLRDVPVPAGLVPIPFPRAQWSADGRRLFVPFAVKGDAPRRIYLRDGEKDWRPVTPEGVRGAFVVSPDGQQLAVADAAGEVTVFPVDAGQPRRLEGERGVPVYWSSDGRWLFLRLGRAAEVPAQIYRRELATDRIEPWRAVGPANLSGVTLIDLPLIARDGAVVVYSPSIASNELFLLQSVR